MHLHIDNPSSVIDVENFFPSCAGICGLENASVFIRTVKSSESADINNVGVLGMYDDLADLKCLFEAGMCPGLATIERLVDTVAIRHRVARIVFARAYPDDLWIAGRDGHRPNGYDFFFIELMFERHTIVARHDQATSGCGSPPVARILWVDCYVDDAAAHVGWADTAPLERLEILTRNLTRQGNRSGRLAFIIVRCGLSIRS